MIRRLDLRGSAVDPRGVLPRAAVDVESVLATVTPIVEDVRDRGAEAVLAWGERLDGVRPPSLRVPQEALDAALAALDPAVRDGARGVDPPSAARARGSAAYGRHDPGRPGRQRHRALAAGRSRRPLRAGRACRLPELRRHERRAGPGGRGAVLRRREPPATRPRRPPAPDDPGRVRAARRPRGVRRWRRPGRRDVRLRHRRRPGRLPSCRDGHRPGQHLRHGGQAPAQGPASASTPRRALPRSRSSPTTPPTRRSSPPT